MFDVLLSEDFLFNRRNTFTGHEIQGCSPKTVKEVNASRNVFKCVNIKPYQQVPWNIYKMDDKTGKLRRIPSAVCSSFDICRNFLANVNVEIKNSNTSLLTDFHKIMFHVMREGFKTSYRPRHDNE